MFSRKSRRSTYLETTFLVRRFGKFPPKTSSCLKNRRLRHKLHLFEGSSSVFKADVHRSVCGAPPLTQKNRSFVNQSVRICL